jgi:hypothetical protein
MLDVHEMQGRIAVLVLVVLHISEFFLFRMPSWMYISQVYFDSMCKGSYLGQIIKPILSPFLNSEMSIHLIWHSKINVNGSIQEICIFSSALSIEISNIVLGYIHNIC